MSDDIEIAGIKVPRAGWEVTPASIQMLVQVLSERLLALEERVNRNDSFPPPAKPLQPLIPRLNEGRDVNGYPYICQEAMTEIYI